MKTLNLIPLLDQDEVGTFIADCWAACISYEEAMEVYNEEKLYEKFYFSEKMYKLVTALLDEELEVEHQCCSEEFSSEGENNE